MTDNPWTPGPWEINTCAGERCVRGLPVVYVMDSDLCTVCDLYQGGPELEAFGTDPLANARLIAAAPDLYDTLEAVAINLQMHGAPSSMSPVIWQTLVDNAWAALAKARGESNE